LGELIRAIWHKKNLSTLVEFYEKLPIDCLLTLLPIYYLFYLNGGVNYMIYLKIIEEFKKVLAC